MMERQGDGEKGSKALALPFSLSPAFFQFIGLALILAVAAALRFYGQTWDGGYLFHPDERKILLVVSELRLPGNLLDFFSSESSFNPKFFAYGSFPIYLLKALSIFAPTVSMNVPWREDFIGLAILGRTLSALFDLGTIAFVFLLARRLYDARVGLISSACVAVTVLHIQLAHFYAVDTLLTLLVVATMYWTARYAQTGKRRDAVLMGAAFGLALATKVTAAPLIVPIIVAVVRVSEMRSDPELIGLTKGVRAARALGRWMQGLREWRLRVWRTRRTLVKILGIAFAVFIFTQPYVLLDPIRYFGQVGTELFVARGWIDYTYTRQYANTLPFVYLIAQSSVWGTSLPLGILTWGGSALFVCRWWRKRDWRDGLILVWVLVYFLAVGGQYTKYLRYLLPLTPFLFLMAARVLRNLTRNLQYVLRITLYVSLVFALLYAIAFVSLYSREHPFLQISKWIYANIPSGATIAAEHWDDGLPVPIRGGGNDRSPTDYRIRILPMYDVDDAKKTEVLLDTLTASDYLVLASQRLSGTITRLTERYPVSSRYYQLLFSGKLGYQFVANGVNGIAADGLVIVDDRFDGAMPPLFTPSDALLWNWGFADESFTVYDHPMPLVFQNTHSLPREDLKRLLIP